MSSKHSSGGKGGSRSASFEPEKIAFSSFIGHNREGQSLLAFLSARFTYFDTARWQDHIQKGDVLLNGKIGHENEILKNADEVKYLAMTRPEPKVPTEIPVIFEDQDLLIVNKPAHIPVHPGGRYLRNTLIHVLKKQRKLDFLVLSHRLDRETSGVCVLSKTPLAKDKMYWQFYNSEVEKTYWALCWGILQPKSGIVDAPLGTARPSESRIRIKQVVGGKDSKTARTKYHTLSTKWIEAPQWTPPEWPALARALKGKNAPPWPISLIECRPMTGRTNQIRVHMAHLGAGLVGDKLYDPDEKIFMSIKDKPPVMHGSTSKTYMDLPQELLRRLVLEAHALHAKTLKFRHPRTNKPTTVQAPVPSTWRGLYAPR